MYCFKQNDTQNKMDMIPKEVGLLIEKPNDVNEVLNAPLIYRVFFLKI